MSATAKPPLQVVTPQAPARMLAAVSVALGLMKAAKAATWGQVPALASGRLAVSPEQADLLREASAILPWLHVDPVITIACCPECGRFEFTSSDVAVPSSCVLTRGCGGKPVKAQPAPRVKTASGLKTRNKPSTSGGAA